MFNETMALLPNCFTAHQKAMILAMIDVESCGGTVMEENLNYSEEGLLKVFPKYFTKETAKKYAKKPEAIANRVYANRMGNEDEKSGDGWRYRGRGPIQITGKTNHVAYLNWVGEKPEYGYASAIWFLTMHLLTFMQYAAIGDVVKCTELLNGGHNGLAEREEKYHHYLQLLTSHQHD
jgi:putative chitinase